MMRRLRLQPPIGRKSLRVSFCAILAFLVTIMCSLNAGAQSTFSSFVGTIKDPQGAVVVGATVKLYNLGMAGVRQTVTGADGQYSFLNVDAGSYRMTVEFGGFQSLEFPGLVLQARETQRIDGTMRLGEQSQSVSVDTAAAVINTDV